MDDAKRQKLEALRAQSSEILGKSRQETYPFPGLPSGLPRGAITEVSGSHGSGKTKLVASFLALNPELRCAWIEEILTVYPPGIAGSGINLSRILFIDAGKDFTWAIRESLKSGLFQVFVLSGKLDEIQLRRLQLDAKKAQASCILISERPTLSGRWPIALQLSLSGKELSVLKGAQIRLEDVRAEIDPRAHSRGTTEP